MKYPRRVVLGEGYPWMFGVAHGENTTIQLRDVGVGGSPVQLAYPDCLWAEGLPRYRLILERIDPEAVRP